MFAEEIDERIPSFSSSSTVCLVKAEGLLCGVRDHFVSTSSRVTRSESTITAGSSESSMDFSKEVICFWKIVGASVGMLEEDRVKNVLARGKVLPQDLTIEGEL